MNQHLDKRRSQAALVVGLFRTAATWLPPLCLFSRWVKSYPRNTARIIAPTATLCPGSAVTGGSCQPAALGVFWRRGCTPHTFRYSLLEQSYLSGSGSGSQCSLLLKHSLFNCIFLNFCSSSHIGWRDHFAGS